MTHDSFWWLHVGNRAVRVGDWKIVAAGEKNPWELYNLAVDRGESRRSIFARARQVARNGGNLDQTARRILRAGPQGSVETGADDGAVEADAGFARRGLMAPIKCSHSKRRFAVWLCESCRVRIADRYFLARKGPRCGPYTDRGRSSSCDQKCPFGRYRGVLFSGLACEAPRGDRRTTGNGGANQRPASGAAKRKTSAMTAVSALVALLLIVAPAIVHGANPPPNIVFVIADQSRRRLVLRATRTFIRRIWISSKSSAQLHAGGFGDAGLFAHAGIVVDRAASADAWRFHQRCAVESGRHHVAKGA